VDRQRNSQDMEAICIFVSKRSPFLIVITAMKPSLYGLQFIERNRSDLVHFANMLLRNLVYVK